MTTAEDTAAAPAVTAVTLEMVWQKLLELEARLSGRGADLVTPNQVYRFYQVSPQRLRAAVDSGQIAKYDEGVTRGGFKGYKVQRADVVRVFNLPMGAASRLSGGEQ